jgi:amino acid transporter
MISTLGIIGSLVVSMSVYVAVAVVVVGMAPVSLLGEDVPIINALLANACCTHSDHLSLDATEVCLSYTTCDPILNEVLYLGSRVVSFGAIFGLMSSTFACLMGQPRIFYSMAQDGLLFKIYARVHPTTGVPTIGTIMTGFFTAIIACLFDLQSLANAISLGTLQVFTFVNAGVILLRMRPTVELTSEEASPLLMEPKSPIARDPKAAAVVRSLGLIKTTPSEMHALMSKRNRFNVHDNGSKPVLLVVVFTTCATLASVAISEGWHALFTIACAICTVISAVLLFSLPKSAPPETFTCPMVPAIPLLGILCNCYMMGSMPTTTWSVIFAWLFAGVLFYFGYGIHHSELKLKSRSRATSTSNNNTHKPKGLLAPTHQASTALLPPMTSRENYNSIHEHRKSESSSAL